MLFQFIPIKSQMKELYTTKDIKLSHSHLAFCPITVKEGAQTPKCSHRHTVCAGQCSWERTGIQSQNRPLSNLMLRSHKHQPLWTMGFRDSDPWEILRYRMPSRMWYNCLFWSPGFSPSSWSFPHGSSSPQVTSFSLYIECTLRKLVT